MQLRRHQPTPEVRLMATELIKPFDQLPERRAAEVSPLVSAVLFASGKLVEVDNELHVFGMVLAGYTGLLFGDDGTYTARVASELPLERPTGTRILETYVNEAVQAANPSYVAEHVGYCDIEEASAYLRARTKETYGESVPEDELSWQNGRLTLWQPDSVSAAGSP